MDKGQYKLVGRIVSDTRAAIKAGIVRAALSKSWPLDGALEVGELEGQGRRNTFLFTFSNQGDKQRVVQQGPWSVMGNHLILKQYCLEELELELSRTEFWVQAHGLPLEFCTKPTAEQIGNTMFPELVEVDFEDDDEEIIDWRWIVRIKVAIDVEQPLQRGFILPRGAYQLPDAWVSFKYERLPDFCYGCGKLGHVLIHCPLTLTSSNGMYGPWMRAAGPPPKKNKLVIEPSSNARATRQAQEDEEEEEKEEDDDDDEEEEEARGVTINAFNETGTSREAGKQLRGN